VKQKLGEAKIHVDRKIHYHYQGREAVLSSSTRNREASMGASIRSSKSLTEHVRCGRLCSYFNIIFFTICINIPFLEFLLELLCTMIVHAKQISPLKSFNMKVKKQKMLGKKSRRKSLFKSSRTEKHEEISDSKYITGKEMKLKISFLNFSFGLQELE
jgi:hypothetical protein